MSDWQNQQSYDFNVSQFDYQKQQDEQARADAQAAAEAQAAASKGSGRSSGKSKSYSVTANDISALTDAYYNGGYMTLDKAAEELEKKGADPETLLALRDKISKSTKMKLNVQGR